VGTAGLRQQVEARAWYHTIELAPGLVTPGWFDTREVLPTLPIPTDLSGQRCLDVGTFDGFWAFEMERRGAAEVLAVDVLDPTRWDWPANASPEAIREISSMKGRGEGFEIAAEALGSTVKRLELSVYDLDPDEHGTFDFVYVGSLLLHLRDPMRAVDRIRSVCRGTVLFVDAVDFELSWLFRKRPVTSFDGNGRPWWWKPNTAAFARYLESGSLEVLQGPTPFFMIPGKGQPLNRPSPRALRTHAGREAWLTWWRGDPHAAVLARPAS
jgi:tRNA (mo5U34)-methyltransferase